MNIIGHSRNSANLQSSQFCRKLKFRLQSNSIMRIVKLKKFCSFENINNRTFFSMKFCSFRSIYNVLKIGKILKVLNFVNILSSRTSKLVRLKFRIFIYKSVKI